MRRIKPVPVAHKYKRKAFMFKDLKDSTHVFRRDHAKIALERPYMGPHRILKRTSERVYKIDFNGVSVHVSIKNIKPAYFMRYDIDQLPSRETVPLLRTYSRKRVSFMWMDLDLIWLLNDVGKEPRQVKRPWPWLDIFPFRLQSRE